jgi:hypothetical protein
MSYEQDIVTDETSLDVEWLDQPVRMGKYCKLAAAAHRDMDLAKENLEFVRATLKRAIGAAPAEYGVVAGPRGITEGSIDAAIQVHAEYQEASRAYIDAKYEDGVARGVVKAFEDRKSQLENLVRLHGQSYFAGPSVPRNLSEERARRDQSAQRRVRIGNSALPRTSMVIQPPLLPKSREGTSERTPRFRRS